jgi:hypothetical protein
LERGNADIMSAASRERERLAREKAKAREHEDMPGPDEMPPNADMFFAGRNADGTARWEEDSEFSRLMGFFIGKKAEIANMLDLEWVAVDDTNGVYGQRKRRSVMPALTIRRDTRPCVESR